MINLFFAIVLYVHMGWLHLESCSSAAATAEPLAFCYGIALVFDLTGIAYDR